MCHFIVASDGTVTWQPSHPYPEPGEAATHGTAIATIILDRSGTVRYCHADAARLFHTGPNTLVGRHVTEMIPELPLARRTSGYNAAYVTFRTPQVPRACSLG